MKSYLTVAETARYLKTLASLFSDDAILQIIASARSCAAADRSDSSRRCS